MTVTEEDATGNSYTVVLETQPTADVVVTVAGHAGTEVTPAPTTLTFTATNWNTAQTVTVTAGDDADLVNDTVTLTHSAASTDTDYSGITITEVTVTVNDNDTAQVTGVTVAAGNARLVVAWTAVGNATGYKVQWKSGSQGYNATDRQATLASGSTTSHTIPSLVNGTEYTVRVTATRTDANDGPPSAEKTGTPAAPTAPGVTMSKTALTVTEQDTTGNSYTVVLDTQPTADVVVTVAGHAGTDVTATPNLLTFTATNWNTAQTVTVKAGDDADLVNETVTLTHSAVSTDTAYNGIPIAAVTVTVNDNDRSNTPPVFTGGTTQTRTLAETMGGARAGTAAAIGDPVAATDADDALTYSLGGTDAGKFDFLASSAQLRTKANERYDFEAQPSYAVTVTVDDGRVSVSAAVTISLTDVDEPPLAPAAPTVTATPNATDRLSVSWSAPSNTGRPAIDSYDLQYREGTTGIWTDGPQNVNGTSTTIAGLAADPAAYQVEVRATNDEGDGPWSPTGRIGGGGGGGARNDPPLAVDDVAETVEGTAVFIDVLANDSDPNGDTLTVVEVSAPAHGTAVVAAAGTMEYTPEPDFHGTDRFTYVVGDGSGLTARAAVEVTVLPVNDPPLAVDDAAETVEGTAVFIDVLANDSDPNGDTLTVVEVSAPVHGTAVAAAGTGEYTPGPDFHGTDRLTYVVGDGSGLTARAAVEVTVLPVNDPPLAVDDAAETVEGTAVFIDVLANDSDPNGDTLTVVEVSAPAHGTAVVAAAGTVEYTSGPDFHGTDRLTYVVGDGSGLTARAAVEVTVLPVNDPPLAGDDAADTPEDTSVTIAVLANDSDPDGDTLTVVEVSAPVHGTAAVVAAAAAGTVEYTPGPDFHGTDRLTYVVGDGSGLTARAAVEVTVLPVNDPPLAGDDAADTPEDTSVTIAVLRNDSDGDGDALALVEASAPAHGSARLTDAGAVEYTPANPHVQVGEHSGSVTEAEVPAPPDEVWRQLFDELRQAHAERPASQPPDSHLEPVERLRRNLPLTSVVRDAKTQEPALLGLGHGALGHVDLQPKLSGHESADAAHDTVAGSMAADVDVAVVGIATESLSDTRSATRAIKRSWLTRSKNFSRSMSTTTS